MAPVASNGCSPRFTVVVMIPTGIGAAIGGYAGDAIPVIRAIAQVADCVITHPNVLNGAQLYWPLENVLYVEGYGLDQFAAGVWNLRPVHQNRIGLLLDQGIEPELRLRHIQSAEACRATLGLDLTDYLISDRPLGVRLLASDSGATWGTLAEPGSLLRGVERLIQEGGAEAITIVSRCPDDLGTPALQAYRSGQGVDPLAGAEAVMSHLVVQQFQCPAAHAPALLPLPLDATISPRSAAEELGYTFLPSVLVGLSRAPQFMTATESRGTLEIIDASQVNAVIIPASAAGGRSLFHWHGNSPIITVADNQTTLNVYPHHLGFCTLGSQSYAEAIGVLAALRAGVHPPRLQAAIAPLAPLTQGSVESPPGLSSPPLD
ncbi:DUF3326 domain-containing protein [Candidatus Synechococcus calcipolaris G9]|uniref:DUF3326 domain-containing protein n=1 Tax=Candidatus Synechococcus calcipolaris G9 TaxID=1497997 RepID=A0ABT6F1G2_9SYNE|nr:DUF3326 domain-containing protein [Candidatus Synechococcus calcipolaris]MDG2991655.1 DUF3326 domain-containing protein [Candidatus Synechococcus calcipolaris G9]